MERILVLLNERNHYFKKFKNANDAELLRLRKSDFSHIDIFYKTRENILNMVAHIEDLIETRLGSPEIPNAPTREMKKQLVVVLNEKDRLVKDILSQDLELLSMIDDEKSKIISNLQTLTNGKKAIGAYKHSTPTPRLDEEI